MDESATGSVNLFLERTKPPNTGGFVVATASCFERAHPSCSATYVSGPANKGVDER